jgi:hypothetical protein
MIKITQVLSKHLPLFAHDFNVVANATALIMINIAAAVAAYLGHPPQLCPKLPETLWRYQISLSFGSALRLRFTWPVGYSGRNGNESRSD